MSRLRPLLCVPFLLFSPTIFARKTRVTWVNGIAHRVDHMVEGQVAISKFFGGKPIIYCHNPTAMQDDGDTLGYLTDLTQAGSQKLGRSTTEVATLAQHLKESIQAVGSRGCIIHIAHSQGALITSLAAQHYLTPAEMERMEVISFGGATALRRTASTPFKRCINYYAINDPLLLLVPSAVQSLRSGIYHAESEFCFLAPRCGDPVADHHLWGATYSQALKWEGERFQRLYVSWGKKQAMVIRTLIDAICRFVGWVLARVEEAIRKRVITPAMLGFAIILNALLAAVRGPTKEESTYEPVDASVLGGS